MGQCCVSVGLYNCVCIHGKNTLQFPVSPLRHTGCIHSPHQPYRTFPFLYSTLPFPCSLSPRYTPPMYWMSEVVAAAAEPSSRQPDPSRASLQKVPVNLSPLSKVMVPVGTYYNSILAAFHLHHFEEFFTTILCIFKIWSHKLSKFWDTVM